MSGTKQGGIKASITNKALYGDDWFNRIGALGGKKSRGGGFSHAFMCDCDYKEDLHKKASCAGYRGGVISKRRAKV